VAALPYVDPQAAQSRPRRRVLRLLSARPMTALERSLVFRLVIWRIVPRLIHLTGGRFARTLPIPADVIETRDARNGRRHYRRLTLLLK
jgi:hypothetical protein